MSEVKRCKRGLHEMTEENTFRNSGNGRRQCRQCRYETQCTYRREKLAEMRADKNHRYHGTTHGYSCGCRCLRCAIARSQYMREWRIKRGLPVTPEGGRR